MIAVNFFKIGKGVCGYEIMNVCLYMKQMQESIHRGYIVCSAFEFTLSE